MAFVRTPISAPLVRTRSGEAPRGVDGAVGFSMRSTGSSVIVLAVDQIEWLRERRSDPAMFELEPIAQSEKLK
jgi:hypothetical protein